MVTNSQHLERGVVVSPIETGGSGPTLTSLFRTKQTEMLTVLRGVGETFDQPVVKGSATEENWRSFLRAYLPVRYQVDSGIVMDSTGGLSDQIDLLILDRQYSPLLFESGGQKYIPAESVYAAMEVKQQVTRRDVEYAADKIASVRRLHRSSVPIVHAGGAYDPRPPLRIIGGLMATRSSWDPPFGEPFESSLESSDTDSHLDLVCALSHGTVSVEYSNDGRPAIQFFAPELSLVSLLFGLLEILQGLGTVPAIDYSKYMTGAE